MADQRDPYDGDYIGNIFGWKISLVGLVLIVALTALAAYRHVTLDVPLGFKDPLEMEREKERFAPAGKADRANQITPDTLEQ